MNGKSELILFIPAFIFLNTTFSYVPNPNDVYPALGQIFKHLKEEFDSTTCFVYYLLQCIAFHVYNKLIGRQYGLEFTQNHCTIHDKFVLTIFAI